MPNQLLPQQTPENKLYLYGLGDYNAQQIKVFARDFEMDDLSSKRFYDRRPDAHTEPETYIKNMDAETATFIVPDAFAGQVGITLVKNMNFQQLAAVGSGNDPLLMLAIKDALRRAMQINPDDPQIQEVHKYITHSPAWQI